MSPGAHRTARPTYPSRSPEPRRRHNSWTGQWPARQAMPTPRKRPARTAPRIPTVPARPCPSPTSRESPPTASALPPPAPALPRTTPARFFAARRQRRRRWTGWYSAPAPPSPPHAPRIPFPARPKRSPPMTFAALHLALRGRSPPPSEVRPCSTRPSPASARPISIRPRRPDQHRRSARPSLLRTAVSTASPPPVETARHPPTSGLRSRRRLSIISSTEVTGQVAL